MPYEILWITLSSKFHLPFEYWQTLDVDFVNKLLITLEEEGRALDRINKN